MNGLLQPAHLFFLAILLIPLGLVFISALRKTREKELQYHQDLRIREMEHQRKMKELEIELEKAKGRRTTGPENPHRRRMAASLWTFLESGLDWVNGYGLR